MGHFRKVISIVLAMLLILPALVHAETNAKMDGISSSLKKDSVPKKQVKGEKEDYKNPADYPLKKDGEFVARLTDTYGAPHDITFDRVTKYTNDKMQLRIVYGSDSVKKEPIVTIEFFKENRGSTEFAGYVDYNTKGYSSAWLDSFIPKATFNDQPYLYLRIGISKTIDDDVYSDVTLFKVKNPFYSPPAGNKYALISNESVIAGKTQNTGAFKINNDHYSLNKKLDVGAYKLDVNKPFDVKKNAAKKIQKKNLSKKTSYKVGDNKLFWVTDFTTDRDYQINPTLLYTGSKTNVWVHNNQITKADAQKFGKEFDQKVYPVVTGNFANESDVDGDGKINILCFDIRDGFSGTGGYIAGYFWARDLFDTPYSNMSEIFYIDTYPSMGLDSPKDVSEAYETLAHEFQHMVNFNQNYFVEEGELMDTWLDEGLSMAAEQIYSGKILADRIDYYNEARSIANGHSLLYWDDYGDVLSNYSLSYLFGQYVRVQAGQGNKIFKEILTDKDNDYRAVENAAKKYIDPKMTFGKLMTNFRGALLLNQSKGLYGFKGEAGFNALQPRLFNGSSANLKGGGAVVKRTNVAAIPASKGNDITYTFFDIVLPKKPVVNAVSDKDTAVKGTAESGVTVFVKAGSANLGSAPVASKKTFSVPIKKQKAGTKLTVYAVDKAGNQSPTVTLSVKDKTPPSMPTVSVVSDKDKKVTGKAEAGSKITVKAGNKVLNTATTDKAGKYTVTLTSIQKAGTDLYVTATDKAGNVSAARKVTVIDKTPPGLPKVKKVTSKSTSVTGIAESYSTVYVKAGKKVIGSGKASKNGSFSVKIQRQKAGTILQVYAKDKAGNIGKASKVTVKNK
ncbi:Ig-like domain-containing protein [Lederbergia citrea]|uniref:Bacterial Ig domain-containing protein n=1 Tax=Lederbergia citrea TaxID=2833581 RepID=A0A942Z6Y8_9BACI|nr:Ig-like domain-containing protein [Lederbergia citrea]MBS4205985.1 hypothetical protein [Lederbergia citrea]MBS4224566.1 hypothetical protein [Lederbergia citrea]